MAKKPKEEKKLEPRCPTCRKVLVKLRLLGGPASEWFTCPPCKKNFLVTYKVARIVETAIPDAGRGMSGDWQHKLQGPNE